MIPLTHHARTRMAQRNIPELWVQLLHWFGESRRQDGGIVRYLDRHATRRLRRQIRQVASRLDSLEDTYLIESATEPVVITTGYHTRRIHVR